MGQVWTKNKPDKAGQWWASHTANHATVVRVTLYDYYGNDELHVMLDCKTFYYYR